MRVLCFELFRIKSRKYIFNIINKEIGIYTVFCSTVIIYSYISGKALEIQTPDARTHVNLSPRLHSLLTAFLVTNSLHSTQSVNYLWSRKTRGPGENPLWHRRENNTLNKLISHMTQSGIYSRSQQGKTRKWLLFVVKFDSPNHFLITHCCQIVVEFL